MTIDESVAEEKSSFKMLGLSFFSLNLVGALTYMLLLKLTLKYLEP